MLGSLAEADEAVEAALLRVGRLGDGVWILEGYVVMNPDADGDVLDDVLSFLCFLLAMFWLKRPSNALA